MDSCLIMAMGKLSMTENLNPEERVEMEVAKYTGTELRGERDPFLSFDNKEENTLTKKIIAAPTWCSMPLLVTDFGSNSLLGSEYISPIPKSTSVDYIYVDTSDRKRKQDSKSNSKQNQNEAKKPFWNLIVLSIGWMLFFMSFSSIRNIQSSINHEGGLGLYSLAGVYGGYMVACFFTTVIVKRLSPKWTLVVGMVSQIIYTLTIMYPKSYIILPISVIGGFMQCAMWTAQGTLIVEVSLRAPNTSMKCTEAVVSKYFGVFYGFASFSPVIGSVIMALLISIAQNKNFENDSSSNLGNFTNDIHSSNLSVSLYSNESNAEFQGIVADQLVSNSSDQVMPKFHFDTNAEAQTKNVNEQIQSLNSESQFLNNNSIAAKSVNPSLVSVLCGTHFCHNDVSEDEKALLDVSMFTRNVLSGTLAACMVIALVGFAVFLEGWRTFSKTGGCAFKQFMPMLKLLKTKRFLLISPLIFYHGIQTAFFSGEVTKAFVGCVFGIEMVGYVTACFGACAAVSAFISGRLGRQTGKLPLFIAGGALDLITLLALRFWTPSSSDMMFVFFTSGFWGLAEGIWATHINSLVGLLFRRQTEAAFSCFNLLVAFGLTSSYASANYVSMPLKMYAAASFCVLGVSFYAVLSRQEASKSEKFVSEPNG